MTDLTATAERLKAKMGEQNPALAPADGKAEPARRRISMSNVLRKLEVQKIPGYYQQWIRGDAARIQQAMNAGFTFVRPEEVNINNRVLGDDGLKSGNTDLGDRVSVADGEDVAGGSQPIRLYLMKQLEADHDEDLQILQHRNDRIADSMTASFRSGEPVRGAEDAPEETSGDLHSRFVDRNRTKVPDLFKRKTKR